MNEIYLNQLQTEVELRNFAPSTERMYRICIRQFVEYTKKSQGNYTAEDVRTFLLFKKKSGSKASTVILHVSRLMTMKNSDDFTVFANHNIYSELSTVIEIYPSQSLFNSYFKEKVIHGYEMKRRYFSRSYTVRGITFSRG